MTTMLERAARAAAKNWDEDFEECSRSGQSQYLNLARAVLMAVRVDDPVYMVEQRFNDRIDAILEGK